MRSCLDEDPKWTVYIPLIGVDMLQVWSAHRTSLSTGFPHHVRELRPIIGLNTSESRSDSELSTQSVRMITIKEAHGDPLEVNNAYAMDDASADELSSEEVPLPRRSTRCKRPAPGCHLCVHQIIGECREIERQNLQAVGGEPNKWEIKCNNEAMWIEFLS